jgi:hypothetical protein
MNDIEQKMTNYFLNNENIKPELDLVKEVSSTI